MKKIILILALMIFFAPVSVAGCVFPIIKNKAQKQEALEIKKIKTVFKLYGQYENTKNIEGIGTLHSDNYITADAMPKKIYLDIINKTWNRYSDIKHNLKIKRIDVNGEYATAEVEETLIGKTFEKFENKTVEGDLKSVSNVVYYLVKQQGKWKFLSDFVAQEQTFLLFDDAKNLDVEFYAPNRILADKDYVATLNVDAIPRGSLIIATIGQERIIYPHKNAEEVYRKLPDNGVLERVFTANEDNLNEYVVATYCITKPQLDENNQLETTLTGVGYVINRVNIVPENKFITVEDNGKKEKK